MIHSEQNRFINNKIYEAGQSLVEFIFVLPLFFIVMSGTNLYLNQQIKSLTDHSTHDALLIADAHFDDQERMQAGWSGAHLNTPEYIRMILKNSFNASQYFSHSVDLKDGVFLDKKVVKQTSQNSCSVDPFYKFSFVRSGRFEFQSCADGSGFETAHFSYQDSFENFKMVTAKYDGRSLYYPNDQFSWSQRRNSVVSAVKQFEFTTNGHQFSAQYASLKVPVDRSYFNSKCLMNAGRMGSQGADFQNGYRQNCGIPSLAGKWKRAAYDGANTQIFECFAEMAAQCLKMVVPASVAKCVAAGTAEIEFAIMSGKQASVCPILNNFTTLLYKETLLTSKTLNLKRFTNESMERAFLMGP